MNEIFSGEKNGTCNLKPFLCEGRKRREKLLSFFNTWIKIPSARICKKLIFFFLQQMEEGNGLFFPFSIHVKARFYAVKKVTLIYLTSTFLPFVISSHLK